MEYMAGDDNLLWCLLQRDESDEAYHSGADIRLLSQFQEHEVPLGRRLPALTRAHTRPCARTRAASTAQNVTPLKSPTETQRLMGW